MAREEADRRGRPRSSQWGAGRTRGFETLRGAGIVVGAASAGGLEVRLIRASSHPSQLVCGRDVILHVVAGCGLVRFRRDRRHGQTRCRPGDVVVIPDGWSATLAADVADHLVVLAVTTSSGMPADTVWEPRLFHTTVAADWDGSGPVSERTVLNRVVETPYMPGALIPQQNFSAFNATLTADPASYRVERVGPFEYVVQSDPVPRLVTEDVADVLAKAVCGLPVVLEGSQSPLSLKPPHSGSDADVLVVVDSVEQLQAARKALHDVAAVQEQVDIPLSVGIVLRSWLSVPYFYSAVDLRPDAPDRRWWTATPDACLAEARLRIEDGLRLLEDEVTLREIRDATLAVIGGSVSLQQVVEWRLTPRWLGLEVIIAGI